MKMRFDLHTIRDRHARLVRALAVFFLLFTGADIVMPEYFCGQEEQLGGIALKAVSPGDARRAPDRDLVASADEDSRSSEPAPEAPHEEDCFCCCAHVVPAQTLSLVAAPVAVLPPDAPVAVTVPSPPLPTAYRPPRSA